MQRKARKAGRQLCVELFKVNNLIKMWDAFGTDENQKQEDPNEGWNAFEGDGFGDFDEPPKSEKDNAFGDFNSVPDEKQDFPDTFGAFDDPKSPEKPQNLSI